MKSQPAWIESGASSAGKADVNPGLAGSHKITISFIETDKCGIKITLAAALNRNG